MFEKFLDLLLLIQTRKRYKRMLIYCDTDTKSAIFRGNPLCQAAKRHLTVKWLKTMKNEIGSEITYLFLVKLLFSYPVLGRMLA